MDPSPDGETPSPVSPPRQLTSQFVVAFFAFEVENKSNNPMCPSFDVTTIFVTYFLNVEKLE